MSSLSKSMDSPFGSWSDDLPVDFNSSSNLAASISDSAFFAAGSAFLMAGAALVSSAAIATASTSQDDAYLAQLRAVGLTWPPQTEEALIGEAHLICYDLTWGWTPQQIADEVHQHLDKRGVTLLDVGTMVDAAHSTYCPGNVCDAPTLFT